MGITMGWPGGSRDKERMLDPHREQIKEYLNLGLSLRRIRIIINPQLERSINYPAYRYFVRQDPELLKAWQSQKHAQS